MFNMQLSMQVRAASAGLAWEEEARCNGRGAGAQGQGWDTTSGWRWVGGCGCDTMHWQQGRAGHTQYGTCVGEAGMATWVGMAPWAMVGTGLGNEARPGTGGGHVAPLAAKDERSVIVCITGTTHPL